MELFTTRFTLLAVLAAIGYGVATIGMKLASDNWSTPAFTLISLGFVAAVLAEIVLMRGITLGVLYLVIIAFETIIVLGYAFAIGEGLSPKEALGGVMILLGLAVVSH